jgi:hypothetical protein
MINPATACTSALLTLAACTLALPATATGVASQGTWQRTLQPRDLDGDGSTDAFYDLNLDITWLRDAGALPGGRPASWDAAKAWADNLSFGGYTDWRLPTLLDNGSPYSTAGGTVLGYNVLTLSGNTVYSEMAHLWYVTLGNKAAIDPGNGTPVPSGTGLTNTGDFQNLSASPYWTDLEYERPIGHTEYWIFATSNGEQLSMPPFNRNFAMAVRSGDVGVVPEPQTWAMLLGGLAVLSACRLRRAR